MFPSYGRPASRSSGVGRAKAGSRDSDRILIRRGSHALGAIVPICRSFKCARLCASEHSAAIRSQSRAAAVKRQVLWVDKAGFLSVPQILELQEFAAEHNCRLVLTGDTKQHHSVERGDALRILERSGVIAQATLTKILVSGFPSYVQRRRFNQGPHRKGIRQTEQVWSHLRDSGRH